MSEVPPGLIAAAEQSKEECLDRLLAAHDMIKWTRRMRWVNYAIIGWLTAFIGWGCYTAARGDDVWFQAIITTINVPLIVYNVWQVRRWPSRIAYWQDSKLWWKHTYDSHTVALFMLSVDD